MFSKKLFRKEPEPHCVYCARGAQLEGDRILCPKKGLKRAGDSCRGFRYDPLKRVPPKPARLDVGSLDKQDFSL